MVENPKDPDKEEKGHQFTPTDWDWVMFLSGEINAVKTIYDTFLATAIAVAVACIGFIIACLIFQITYLGSSDIVIIVGAVIFGFACCVFLINKEKKRETEERVKPLKKCREDIFNRLDDPNKILECYLNAVGKKGDKNK
jgi:hypothetical protein